MIDHLLNPQIEYKMLAGAAQMLDALSAYAYQRRPDYHSGESNARSYIQYEKTLTETLLYSPLSWANHVANASERISCFFQGVLPFRRRAVEIADNCSI